MGLRRESATLLAWEREAETVKDERRPDGYLDLLTWQSRRILLIPEEDDCGNTVVRQGGQ